MAILGFDSVAGSHYFHAFLEFRVDDLRKRLRQCRREGRHVSLTAFFLRAVAQVLREMPAFNSLLDYRRVSASGQVDIAVPIEIVSEGRMENRQIVIRDASNRTVDEITHELERAKQDTTRKNGFIANRTVEWLLARAPRSLVRWLFRSGLRHHEFVRKLSGTTFVTLVGMFSNAPGFILPFTGGPKACSFAFGSISRKPWVVGNEITICEVISLTASFNHDIIDGAPAARFVNRLRGLVETEFGSILEFT